MFCNQCGKIVPEGSKFCPNCGKEISVAIEKSSEVQGVTVDVSNIQKNAGITQTIFSERVGGFSRQSNERLLIYAFCEVGKAN